MRPSGLRSLLRVAVRRLFQATVSLALLAAVYAAWIAGIADADPGRRTPAEPAVAERPGASLESAELADDGDELLVFPESPLSGREAMRFNIRVLEEGCRRLARVPDYTTLLYKRESVGGVLGDGQQIRMKLRRDPHSVYLCWLTGDKGREVIYVAGENDGDLLYHPGGWRARLLPPLKLNPHGAIALRASRHPVTDLGLAQMARRIIQRRQRDLERPDDVAFRMLADRPFDGRDCWCFELEYLDRNADGFYRKSVLQVDKDLLLAVNIVTYGWPEPGDSPAARGLDEATLVEHYSFSEIRLNRQLADLDFDRGNREYNFRR